MARTKDADVVESAPADSEPAGRVEFDSRGNSVWKWAREVIDSTSVLLKRLENKDLAIEPTQKVPVLGDKSANAKKPGRTELSYSDDDGHGSGGGFDPYNSRRR
jgi:hypothetical protein